jgi:DNA (cytosine-5)-methyltransferase 1
MEWRFAGRKTARYRQVGNAFPPPVAAAVGRSVLAALRREGERHDLPELAGSRLHDPLYKVLRAAGEHLTAEDIIDLLDEPPERAVLDGRLAHLAQDFVMDVRTTPDGPAYKLGEFRAFVGQEDHDRHEFFAKHRSRVS